MKNDIVTHCALFLIVIVVCFHSKFLNAIFSKESIVIDVHMLATESMVKKAYILHFESHTQIY